MRASAVCLQEYNKHTDASLSTQAAAAQAQYLARQDAASEEQRVRDERGGNDLETKGLAAGGTHHTSHVTRHPTIGLHQPHHAAAELSSTRQHRLQAAVSSRFGVRRGACDDMKWAGGRW